VKRLILCIVILGATAALSADEASNDPTSAVIADHNERMESYLADYVKRVSHARELFERSAGASAGLTVKKLEDLAARSIREGDLKAAGLAYQQVLRLDAEHEKARGYFESLGQLDAALAAAKADPLPIKAPASNNVGDAAEAWRKVLEHDRNDPDARKFFDDRGELRKVLAAVTPEPPNDAAEWKGHRYKLYDVKLTTQQATRRCQELGGHLVRIDTDEERVFVQKMLDNSAVWIDGSDAQQEGVWRYSDGQIMRYFEWTADGANNAHGGQHYLSFGSTGKMWDGSSDIRMPFICEWPSREEQLK